MRLLILSDIHGNVSALNCVLDDAQKKFQPDMAAILGDTIDYGMRSNEALLQLEKLSIPVVCSLWGNHEYAILNEEYSLFSSMRGVLSAKQTRSKLTEASKDILNRCLGKSGYMEFTLCGKRFLAVHGSLADPFWQSIMPTDNLKGYEMYDYVLSGHSHYAYAFPFFSFTDDPKMRDRKRTMFINPGSVGQPRNHDPRAQYAVWDSKAGISLCGVEYDIAFEQSLFQNNVDSFYRDRLSLGI